MNSDEKSRLETKAHGKHKYGAEYMSHRLEVSGLVETPLSLKVCDLMKMNPVEINSLVIVCGSGTEKGTVGIYRGVLLRDIINMASVVITEHHMPNRLYVKLVSNDGYMALFSWQELFNTTVGEKAVVIFERDGKLLGEDEGEFAFVSANDIRPGPRRMRYLRQIEICEVR